MPEPTAFRGSTEPAFCMEARHERAARRVRPLVRHETRPLTVCLDVTAGQLRAVSRVKLAACLTWVVIGERSIA